MKLKSMLMGAFMALGLLSAQAEVPFLNLTPTPKKITQTEGEYRLSSGFSVYHAGLDAAMSAEVVTFVEAINRATKLQASISAAETDANVRVSLNASLPREGYTLNVSAEGVQVAASHPDGLFYAFQTIKKLLPANVMAGVARQGAYALPYVDIVDEPRFEYRGFMLDVCRHFFTVAEVKRMLDVMSYYKMNKFHWHLTEDQGWRIEMPKWPKLTTIGATAPNARMTDYKAKSEYWYNKPYGPYFYTIDELKEVVAYAKSLHIDVVPEVEMPGHFSAVNTAYPELSCWPNGAHSVAETGGVYSDVLNVASPYAEQFYKDVIDLLVEVFPYEMIHIGGDECPTSAWVNNDLCKAKVAELGLTGTNDEQKFRKLQSWFTKQVADYAASKGKKIACWNETITSGGSDLDVVKTTGVTIFGWYPADASMTQAVNLNLPCVYTPYSSSAADKGSFYINRKQDPNDPPANGNTYDTVDKVYNTTPFTTQALAKPSLCRGVQGTFWTERVSDREYMEWLALPRLLAIAEIGWTPQAKKNWTSFRKRMSLDRELLDYNGYAYSPHFMEDATPQQPATTLPAEGTWYNIATKATNRNGAKYVTLESDQYIYGRDPNATDAQLWTVKQDPENPGYYALVCKAAPEGSVNGTAEGELTGSKFKYDPAAVHYDFVFDTERTGCYGVHKEYYYYALKSRHSAAGVWINMAMPGKNYIINQYSNPNDGDGGLFVFRGGDPVSGGGSGETPSGYPVMPQIQAGLYVIENATSGHFIADNGQTLLASTQSPWDATLWTLDAAINNADNSQSIKPVNQATSRGISGAAAWSNKAARAVNAGTDAKSILAISMGNGLIRLTLDGKSLWPQLANAPVNPSTIAAGNSIDDANDASIQQDIAWKLTPVEALTYICKDEAGADLFTGVRGVPFEAAAADFAPEITNHTLVATSREGNTINCTYRRSACTVTIRYKADNGALALPSTILSVAPGERCSLSVPEVPYYTYKSCSIEGSEFTATGDMLIDILYTTESYPGVASLASAVGEIEPGMAYAIHDDHSARHAYRYGNASKKIAGTTTIEGQDPYHAWTFETYQSGYSIKNIGWNLYAALVTLNNQGSLVSSAKRYAPTFNGSFWTIKNGTNDLCWDGQENLNMVGWNAPGHPHSFYEFVAEPYFKVTVTAIDTDGKTLSTTSSFVRAGAYYEIVPAEIPNLYFQSMSGHDNTKPVVSNEQVTLLYSTTSAITEVATDGPNSDTRLYDLQGRRVIKPAPGLYLRAGRLIRL